MWHQDSCSLNLDPVEPSLCGLGIIPPLETVIQCDVSTWLGQGGAQIFGQSTLCVCVCGCFWMRLTFALIDSGVRLALPDLDRPHQLATWTGRKRLTLPREGEEPSFPAALSWDTGLFLSFGLTLKTGFPGFWVHYFQTRTTPSSFLALQLNERISQPPSLCEPIPYNKSLAIDLIDLFLWKTLIQELNPRIGIQEGQGKQLSKA